MGYIDIHSHILPDVDDGAKSVEESIALLLQEKANGVSSVVCTPHFYPEVDSFENNIQKTRTAFLNLKKEIEGMDLPEIFLGHEVQYFHGISRCTCLDDLCISNTNYILIELPFLYGLKDWMIDEIVKMENHLGVNIIIAHIDRYINDKNFKKLLKKAQGKNIFFQINADSVLHPLRQKAVIKLFKKGIISFIASDTHSVKDRPVLLTEAFKILKEHCYPQLVHCYSETAKFEELLKGKNNDNLF